MLGIVYLTTSINFVFLNLQILTCWLQRLYIISPVWSNDAFSAEDFAPCLWDSSWITSKRWKKLPLFKCSYPWSQKSVKSVTMYSKVMIPPCTDRTLPWPANPFLLDLFKPSLFTELQSLWWSSNNSESQWQPSTADMRDINLFKANIVIKILLAQLTNTHWDHWALSKLASQAIFCMYSLYLKC